MPLGFCNYEIVSAFKRQSTNAILGEEIWFPWVGELMEDKNVGNIKVENLFRGLILKDWSWGERRTWQPGGTAMGETWLLKERREWRRRVRPLRSGRPSRWNEVSEGMERDKFKDMEQRANSQVIQDPEAGEEGVSIDALQWVHSTVRQ